VNIPAPIRAALRRAGAALAMFIAGNVASFAAFPIGGGEFHAMFAYSDGNLSAAYVAFCVYVGTVCAVAALLVATGYRLPWAVLALAATAVAGVYWWDVYTWDYGHSRVFHRTVGVMLLTIPVIASAACGAAHALRRRVLARITARRQVAKQAAG
jgi:hypothetical protein